METTLPFSARWGVEGWQKVDFIEAALLETHCFSTFSIFCINTYRCVSSSWLFLAAHQPRFFSKISSPCKPQILVGRFFYPGGLAKPKALQNQLFAENSKAWWRLAERKGFWQLCFSVGRFPFLANRNIGGGRGGECTPSHVGETEVCVGGIQKMFAKQQDCAAGKGI